MDEIEFFLASLSKLLNWSSTALPKENINHSKKTMHNSNTIQLIKEKNMLDIRLYEYVKKSHRNLKL